MKGSSDESNVYSEMNDDVDFLDEPPYANDDEGEYGVHLKYQYPNDGPWYWRK